MNFTSIISFPGLGIGEFTVRSIALQIGNLRIAWYGLIITVGIVLSTVYAFYRAVKNEGIHIDHMYDYAIFVIVSGVLGARLYYVITSDHDYSSFYDVIAIWNGGLAIYGGIIGGIAAIFAVSYYKKIRPFKVLDAAGPGVMIGQMLGRWGNFANGEAFGSQTDLPWRMGLVRNGYDYGFVHPTFLYESLWNLVGFLWINAFYKHKKYDGQMALLYLTWYGLGRFFIEGLRTDSLYVGPFRISQLVGGACFLLGTGALVTFGILHAKGKRLANVTVGEAAEPENETKQKK